MSGFLSTCVPLQSIYASMHLCIYSFAGRVRLWFALALALDDDDEPIGPDCCTAETKKESDVWLAPWSACRRWLLSEPLLGAIRPDAGPSASSHRWPCFSRRTGGRSEQEQKEQEHHCRRLSSYDLSHSLLLCLFLFYCLYEKEPSATRVRGSAPFETDSRLSVVVHALDRHWLWPFDGNSI